MVASAHVVVWHPGGVREATGGTPSRGTLGGPWTGLVLIVALGAGLAIWWFAGGSEWFLEGGLERLVRGAGPAGPVVFVVSMWLIQPFGLPGTLWIVPAGVVWPWPVAVALSWVGNMGASSIAFAFARVVGRDWVAPRLPPTIRAFDQQRLATGGTGLVILLRIVTGQLAPADWLLGVSQVRVRTFLVGTGIGILPGILVAVLGGPPVLMWISDLPLVAQIGLAVLGLGAAVILTIRRRRSGGGGRLLRRLLERSRRSG